MKKTKRKKFDTIEKLATLLSDGFSDMDSRISSMDLRFVELKEVLKSMDKRPTVVKSKVWGIGRRFDSEEIERLDIRSIFARMEKTELAVFGNKR
jgi:hypothetical protein